MEEIDIDIDLSWPGTVPALQQLTHLIVQLHKKVDAIMSTQDELNQTATAIEGDVAQINQGVANVQSELAQLQQNNPAVDFTALNQAVSDLAGATSGVTAAGSEVPPPAPAPAP